MKKKIIETFYKNGALKKRITITSSKVSSCEESEEKLDYPDIHEAIKNGVRDYRTLSKDYKVNFQVIKAALNKHDIENKEYATIDEAIRGGIKDIRTLSSLYRKNVTQVKEALDRFETTKKDRFKEVVDNSFISKVLYNDGSTRKEIPTKNGVIDGVEKSYYTNGAIEFETPYVNGVKHGFQKWHDISGGVKKTVRYEKGLKQN